MTALASTAPRVALRPVAAPSTSQTATLRETTRAGNSPKGGMARAPRAPEAIAMAMRRQPALSMTQWARAASGPVAGPRPARSAGIEVMPAPSRGG